MKKFLFYLRYIVIHKYYVLREMIKCRLFWRGLVHDFSKLLPYEFFPYMEYFYNNPDNQPYFKLLKKQKTFNSDEITELHDLERKVYNIKRSFDYAWCKHQKKNPHHWQYWVLINDDGTLRPLEMPLVYRIEMYCDWFSAGMTINGYDNTLNWYIKNRNNMVLAPKTRQWIEKKIG